MVGEHVDLGTVDPGGDGGAIGLDAQMVLAAHVLPRDHLADVDVGYEVAEGSVDLQMRAEHNVARIDLGVHLPHVEVAGIRARRPRCSPHPCGW